MKSPPLPARKLESSVDLESVDFLEFLKWKAIEHPLYRKKFKQEQYNNGRRKKVLVEVSI